MEVREVSDARQWNAFVAGQSPSQFLQSWEWGNFHQKLRRQVHRFGVFANGAMIAAAQGVVYALPMNQSYLYIPRGPVFADPGNAAVWEALHQAFVAYAKDVRALAVRIEPTVRKENGTNPLAQLGYHETESMQPASTRLLGLHGSEEDILNGMHQKTRYNIRLAERKGVEVMTETSLNALKKFLQLQHITAARDKITPFPDSYFHTMFEVLPEPMRFVMLATYQDMPLAANLSIQFGNTLTYSHGASSNDYRNVMAPHLLQWRAIQLARSKGLQWYDFRGIAPTDDPKHAWAGITRFKAGFGGEAVHYLGTFDYPVERGWYQAYMVGRKLVGLVR